MARLATLALLVVLLFGSRAEAATGAWPAWVQRAPLNTDTSLLGFPSAMGLAKACRYVAYVLNLLVLAGLVYAWGKHEADFSRFILVYVGILIGGMLLSFLLSPYLRGFALLPIIGLTALMLARFCDLPARRAVLVASVFHVYQIAYILAYTTVAARFA